ncbi:MAG: hypothetical protein EZS28_011927 [Streblomastix strix]|uniref:Uncharacterized protein n=1 Tax=Streblomastix strix TaxID=222440 RepID=A0A5J4WC65_9EUKA|nr:MAG: hypothetical protein EZS28_011927 [Streblomastix strix]
MKSEQQIQDAARVIVFFTDSYTQNKQRKENEQSESLPSLTDIVSNLESLQRQILMKMSCKSATQITKLLHSLTTLSRFKVGTHLREEIDQQSLEVRRWSRRCLSQIQYNGDEQDQSKLANQEYGRMMSLSYSTAGGIGDEQDDEIQYGMFCISYFLGQLHQGRNNYQPSFQPLPLLARITEEQIEEEGANEEIEAQIINKGFDGIIKSYANYVKAATLNCFIHTRRR